MRKLFGTDGVRGVANTELTPEIAFWLGMGLVRHVGGRAPGVLIGMDTRRSGHMLEAALGAGVMSAGGNAHLAGVAPTPAVAYLTKKYGLNAGAVISASHNPFLDNGIKFFDGDGFKFDEKAESAIESHMKALAKSSGLKGAAGRPVGGQTGVRSAADNAVSDYVAHTLAVLGGQDFEGFSVVLDCANGAMYEAAPMLFGNIGAKLDIIADAPNGENINLRCGSTHMEGLAAQVLERGADAGFAFDGDGDRCLAVDENGKLIDGDQILSILALHYKRKGTLAKNTVVATIMSNLGLSRMCADNGLHMEKTDVGDKYVLRAMLEKGYTLGGEQSGHIINLAHSTTGDGLRTACELLLVMKETGKKLSALAGAMEKYPQVLVNARVPTERKNGYTSSDHITKAIKALEDRLEQHGGGRALIRPSGTEPLVRVMIEGLDLGEITNEANALAALIEDVLS